MDWACQLYSNFTTLESPPFATMLTPEPLRHAKLDENNFATTGMINEPVQRLCRCKSAELQQKVIIGV
jgi:hypothetical protein